MQEPSSHAQTLSRGLLALEVLAERGPLTIAELATTLGVHRSVAYRLLRTLEDHRLTVRDARGAVRLGPRMATLARGVSPDLQAAALPELTALATRWGLTAFLAVLDRDEAVTLASVEPPHAVGTVVQRPGTRHPADRGAPGLALLAQLTDPPGEHAVAGRLETVRRTGFAVSHDEVIPGVTAVAVPLVGSDPLATIALVHVSGSAPAPTPELAASLGAAATRISAQLG